VWQQSRSDIQLLSACTQCKSPELKFFHTTAGTAQHGMGYSVGAIINAFTLKFSICIALHCTLVPHSAMMHRARFGMKEPLVATITWELL